MVLSLSRAVALLLALFIVLSSFVGAAESAQADDGDDGVSIDVDVLGPPPPTPTPTPRGSGSGGGSTPEPSATPISVDPSDDEVDLGGVLSVGGLTGSIAPNLMAGGTATLSIAVRNSSDFLMSLRLRFWMQNVLGATVADSADVWARDLLPGEKRTITVVLHTVGQWTVYAAHVTVTPPKKVGTTALSPVTRETTLAVPPFLLLLTLATSSLIYVLIRFLRDRRLLLFGHRP